MLLTMNVGNTNLSWGLFGPGGVDRSGRFPLNEESRLANWLSAESEGIDSVALAGVNPPAAERVRATISSVLDVKVSVAGLDFEVALKNSCEAPESVGMDRLLNAYAAYSLCGGDAIVVDFGTAISFSVVSGAGEFLGGAIAPGLSMSVRALHQQTACLPEVIPSVPESFTGTSTEEAIHIGLYRGLPGMLDSILSGLLTERPALTEILGTGGDLDWFCPLSRYHINPQPHLTLLGLKLALEHAEEPAACL